MKRCPSGFTLIELLVVIAILALLAALLLPALSGVKNEAQAVICKSNLSGLGKALAMYTADFGKYPGTRSTPLNFPPRAPEDWAEVWDHRLLRYAAGSKPIFGCPADQPPHAEPASSMTNYSYGYNAYGSGVLPPKMNLGLGHAQVPETVSSLIFEVRESQVKAPSDMIAIGDLTDHPQVFTTTLTPDSHRPYPGAPAGRHNGGANMVFCEGHVEFAKQKSWVELTAAVRRRWNNDNEPHAENWR